MENNIGIMTKIKCNEWISGRLWWLRERELGIKFPLGHADRFHKTLYSSTEAVDSWSQGDDIKQTRYGGVFNLEYSPDGSLLVAACEKKSILMFDPLNRRLIHGIESAHDDCVNCVKFLDQRMFATCSDDKTVALWDARNLKRSIRTLQGHSNWVKNIEYSPSDGLLLTSGFDGTIYTWDINSFTENSFLYNRVFHTNGLMRTRLTPDASKMLMCTTAGYLMVVHNLRLSTLSHDLVEFRPNMYRLMQLSQTTFPSTASFTHLFSHTRKHNRVEFLTDFPVGDDAEVISSLQVHPQGWCALSRNVSGGEKSEWTCVHDIQESNNEVQISDNDYEVALPKQQQYYQQHHEQQQPQQQQQQQQSLDTSRTSGITYSILLQTTASNPNDTRVNDTVNQSSRSNNWQEIRRFSRLYSQMPNSRDERLDNVSDMTNSSNIANNYSQQLNDNSIMRDGDRNIVDNNNRSTASVELHVSTSDIWEALVAIREAREATREYVRELYTARSNPRNWLLRRSTRSSSIGGGHSGINNNTDDDDSNDDAGGNNGENQNGNSHTVVIVGDRGSASIQNRSGNKPMYAIPRNHKVHQNISRLTHYIQEPNVGSGYIKELCFSADGRLICSPFGNGIRLLAFSNKCEELSTCVPPPNTSVELHELATKVNHSNIVLSTKFSPRHCLLVSGCLGGKIVWYQPVI